MGYITKQDFWMGTLYLTRTGKTWSMLICNAGLYSRNEYEFINKDGLYNFVETTLNPLQK